MIQMGGLGVVSFTTLLLMIAGKRIQLKQRMLIQEAYGFDTLTGMVRMVRKMICGTLVVEGIGALLYMVVYIPRYGMAKGIWVSVFTAVSAFCNAGMDLMGADSMMPYVTHPLESGNDGTDHYRWSWFFRMVGFGGGPAQSLQRENESAPVRSETESSQ